ncbi:histidinol-phosphate transaminase [Microlunatus parietis]|uniref:Histidinol-phosphate aminotransferase n=1 Tax=Microlunatus parietis TaxID=682979 RepID=A0A7Y9IAB0_9ACTN|nr:histidinol-phosphate transaminase [Microlunatus parietis]NYE73145.1 histidinol-phosphate aminotransferase [Microlunatus parietis]
MLSRFLRPELAALPAYVPGRPAPVGPGGVSYKLSSNENPYPPLPGVLAAVEHACAGMNRYPDMGNTAVIAATAARLGVDHDQLAFGTGSSGVLYHLLQATCTAGDEVIIAWRSFEAYPIAIKLAGAVPIMVPLGPGAVHDLDAMLAAITPRTKMIILCTPNNPTGPAISHDDLVAFVETVDGRALVVVDEAYVEFADAPPRTIELIKNGTPVVSLRTFSKAYGLAGFRVGYGIADPEIAVAVRKTAIPFGVSLPAQAAVIASLEAEKELLDRVRLIVERRDVLLARLREVGHQVPDSQANFAWLPLGARTGTAVETFSAAGLMVRGYGDDGLRITVGEPEACELAVEVAATLL